MIKKRNLGFTLIEIILAITIVALISGVTFVGFLQFGKVQSLNTALDLLQNNLNVVRSNAMAQILTKCTVSQTLGGHRVDFSSPVGGIHLYTFKEACNGKNLVTQADETQYISYKDISLPSGITFFAAPENIYFVVLSGGIEGSEATVTLQNTGNKKKSVTVNKTGVINAVN